MQVKRIIKNAARCKRCGDVIESRSVHEFRTCSCGGVSVDGGHEYLRRCFDGSPDIFEDLSEYEVIEVPDDGKEGGLE